MEKLAFILALCGAVLFYSRCSKNDGLPSGGITYENGVFSCGGCNDLGTAVSIENENLFIADKNYVYWVVPEGSGWKVKQSIAIRAILQTLLVKEGNLFIGLIESVSGGVGTVKVFENTGDSWEKTQELQAGQNQENFGAAIDLDAGNLIIGAYSRIQYLTWDLESVDPGNVYFYKKEKGLWVSTGEFHSVRPGDYFGELVAIEGQKAFVGSQLSDAIYFFAYDGQNWALRDSHSLKEVNALTLSQDRLVIQSGWHLRSFEIEEHGGLGQNLEFEIDQSSITPNVHGQVIQAHGNLLAFGGARIDEGYHREVILFEFAEGAWKIKRRFQRGQQASSIYGSSFAFSDDWMAIGDPDGRAGQVFVYPME